MDFVEAAAVPIAGNTVLRAMQALGSPQLGSSLFIAGASGAIGSLAIQVAAEHGWRVAASASEDNQGYLRSLGAQLAVDYRDPSWPEQIRHWVPGGVDVAIAIQPGTGVDSLVVVRDGGRLITISGDSVPCERGVRVDIVPHQADIGRELAQLIEQIAAGELRVGVERVYRFENARAALAKGQTRHARGKQVIQLD